jgi:hypothetical protein
MSPLEMGYEICLEQFLHLLRQFDGLFQAVVVIKKYGEHFVGETVELCKDCNDRD